MSPLFTFQVFSGVEHYSFAQLSVDVPIFSVSAISKRFLLPGWRLGWVIVHDRGNVLTTSLRRSLAILTQRILGPCSLAQGALPAILKNTPDSLFEHCNQVYEVNHQIFQAHTISSLQNFQSTASMQLI